MYTLVGIIKDEFYVYKKILSSKTLLKVKNIYSYI